MTDTAAVGRNLGWLSCLTALAALIAAAAPGLAGLLRRWYGFAPAASELAAPDPLALWLTNLRVLGLLLLAALAARERRLVRLLDVVVAVVLGVNVALVGLALGSYGPPLLPWLAHVPLEWAALAVGLAAYRSARQHSPSLQHLAVAAVSGAALLALAAAIETCATPLQ